MTTSPGLGWSGSVAEFLSTPQERWLGSLRSHHQALWGTPPSPSQVQAWLDEHGAVADALRQCATVDAGALAWSLVFEYELPLEGGRRPDLVVLAGGTVCVVEFKASALPSAAALDQVRGYARDLADYHEGTHGRPVRAVLVLLGAAAGLAASHDGAVVTAADGLGRYLADAASEGSIDVDAWVRSRYLPLPTLVEAARRIFRHEPLPHVKAALAAGIPQTVELLGTICDEAAERGERVLAFVTGVPGAGKTLVGIRLVYERTQQLGRATFLSGNGPLVKVLQDALRSGVFVRDLHAFIRTYAINQRVKTPVEHVIVFDEAQRAWDRDYMRYQRRVDSSEPELLVQIGERIESWAALVGLVGEGQEIHSGEEGGIEQWRDAALPPNARERWVVHCPPGLADAFAGLETRRHDRLNLVVSLRSRRAELLHEWVGRLLSGDLTTANRLMARIASSEFPVYLTRDLDEAKAHVRARLAGEPAKRTGLLASSHAKCLARFGIDNGYLATSRLNIARWYNAPVEDPRSSNALTQPVTEFGCQGLELDLPIVCWGEDYRYDGRAWELTPVKRKYRQDDPAQLLMNTYRVLLTRGRDGMVLFVPPESQFDQTVVALLAAGVRYIPEPLDLAQPLAG